MKNANHVTIVFVQCRGSLTTNTVSLSPLQLIKFTRPSELDLFAAHLSFSRRAERLVERKCTDRQGVLACAEAAAAETRAGATDMRRALEDDEVERLTATATTRNSYLTH